MPKSGGGVSGHLDFMHFHDCHPWVNPLVDPSDSGDILVGIMNTLGVPLTIPANTFYGTFTLICSIHQQDRFPWRIAVLNTSTSPGVQAAPTVEETPSFMKGPTTPANIQQRKTFLTTAFDLKKADQLDTPQKIDKALHLILTYLDVFSFDGGFGTTNLIKHTIYTEPGPPIN